MSEFDRLKILPTDPAMRQLVAITDLRRRVERLERRTAAAIQTANAFVDGSITITDNAATERDGPSITVDANAGQFIAVYLHAHLAFSGATYPILTVFDDQGDGNAAGWDVLSPSAVGVTASMYSVPGSTLGTNLNGSGGWLTYDVTVTGAHRIYVKYRRAGGAGSPTADTRRMWVEVR